MTEGPPAAAPAPHTHLVPRRLVLAYFLAALTYFALSLLGGLLMALQLVRHNPLAGIEIFSPGRWRMVHTNAIAYGFIANSFLGLLHWSIPRLTLRPVLSLRLSWFIFAAWQVVVLATAGGILAGQAQAVEWGETPVWIDPLALAGLLLEAEEAKADFACLHSRSARRWAQEKTPRRWNGRGRGNPTLQESGS
jgi:cytochrome c oxidase cbb3-type subunit 1